MPMILADGNILVWMSELIESYYRSHHLPAFLTGVFVGIVLSALAIPAGLKIYRILQPSAVPADMRRLREQSDRLAGEKYDAIKCLQTVTTDRDHYRDRYNELVGQRKSIQEKIDELSDACEQLKVGRSEALRRWQRERKRRRRLELMVVDLDVQLRSLTDHDIKVWERPAMGRVAPFRPLSLRRTPIVSVVNLKGGVGKTTIVANLGAALASKGYRILMVDLDHQGSLTTLCLSREEVSDAMANHRTVDQVLGNDVANRAIHLGQCTTRARDIPGGEVSVVAASELLDRLETRLMMQWHGGSTGDDIRYRLREALHDPELSTRFDLVLLDCPPRLTTGCINALTCSDYALIPVLLEKTSAEAIPRLLQWLRGLRPRICPDISVLGVVGNKAFPRQILVRRQQDVWNNLRESCEKRWEEPVRLFDEAIIRQHDTHTHRLAALDPNHRSRYLDLAEAILKELPAHARRHPSAIPAFADPAAGVVRG